MTECGQCKTEFDPAVSGSKFYCSKECADASSVRSAILMRSIFKFTPHSSPGGMNFGVTVTVRDHPEWDAVFTISDCSSPGQAHAKAEARLAKEMDSILEKIASTVRRIGEMAIMAADQEYLDSLEEDDGLD